jgi:hypothetical protein
MMDRCPLALGQRLLHDHIDHAAVLGMHADQRAIHRCLLQRLEDRCIVYHQHTWIRHEQLEARYAFVDHVVHVFKAGRPQIGHDHV